MLKPRKKITKKELKRDPLVDFLYKVRHSWSLYQDRVTRYGGIALVVIVLAVLVMRWRNTQDAKAAAVVGTAFMELSQGNYNTVIAHLSPVVEEYSGLRSFGNGLFILARAELFVGDTINAETHYQRYLDDYGRDPLLKAGALAGLGIIAEGYGNHGAAAEHFEKASRTVPTDHFKRQYAAMAGRNYLLAGTPEEALDLLNPFLDEQGEDFQLDNEIRTLVASSAVQAR